MGARNEWVGRRQAVRQTCQMRAELRFLDDRKPAECTIIDISATGARLTLPEGFDCPDEFDLYIPSRNETKHAKVRRITEDGVGVAFLKARQEDPRVMQSVHERLTRLERAVADLKGLPRETVAQAPVSSPVPDTRIEMLASGLAELRDMFEARIAAPAPQPVDHAPDIAALRADLSALNARVDELSTAVAQPERMIEAVTSELAEDMAKDFEGIRSEMGKLDTSVRALTEMASVNAALTPADHGPEIVSLRGEVAALAQAVRDATVGAPPPSRPTDDLSEIRAEMQKLGVSMRGQAHIPAPDVLRAHAEITDLKAEIAELRAALADMAAPTSTPQRDASGLGSEVEDLRQSVRALILLVAKSLNASRDAA